MAINLGDFVWSNSYLRTSKFLCRSDMLNPKRTNRVNSLKANKSNWYKFFHKLTVNIARKYEVSVIFNHRVLYFCSVTFHIQKICKILNKKNLPRIAPFLLHVCFLIQIVFPNTLLLFSTRFLHLVHHK